jgi:hypothetical protein
VRSGEVKNRSLLRRDFKPGQLPAGAQGQQGPAGPAGVLFGAAGGSAVIDPVPAPEESLDPGENGRRFSFKLPSAGRALVEFRVAPSATCSVGNPVLGLYVDGAPVPGSGRVIDNAADETELAGLTGVLAAGPHTAEALADCPDGTLGPGAAEVGMIWSVLLVGG